MYYSALNTSMTISKERYEYIQTIKNNTEYDENYIKSYLSEYEHQNINSKYCGAYSTFEGSPISKGIFQFDMWNVKPSNNHDWTKLKENINLYGIRNSLLIAPMPTASTSQILGYNECFEPFTSNIYKRSTLAGDFTVINKYLIKELIDMNKWDKDIKDSIIANEGSVQHLHFLSEHQKNKYKTVWELSMKDIIDMSADRGAYICQSQSTNYWMKDPTRSKLTSMHFYAWNKGLKTGIYYLRRKAKHKAQQFTIEPENKNKNKISNNEDVCEVCSA